MPTNLSGGQAAGSHRHHRQHPSEEGIGDRQLCVLSGELVGWGPYGGCNDRTGKDRNRRDESRVEGGYRGPPQACLANGAVRWNGGRGDCETVAGALAIRNRELLQP